MPMLVAGLLLLWLSSVLLRGYTRADPAALARLARKGGGSVALALAVLLILRGEFNLALLAGGCGLWLLGSGSTPLAGMFAGRTGAGRSARIHVRTLSLDVLIDPATGAVRGRFIAGPLAGRALETLSRSELAAGYQWCVGADPRGIDVLETDLDRRLPGWREAPDFQDHARRAQAGGRARHPMGMPEHEAYHVLGLAQGASREEITRAHRRLMKQYHPDHGGSTALAARVNEAKDVLMRRHP